MNDLAVAVVSYHSLPWLLRSAETWSAAAGKLSVQWCVVENGTGEPVADRLAGVQPDALVTPLPRSVSFAAAVNRALEHTDARHVALLNPDTRLAPASLERLVAHLDAHPEVGIVGPRVWDDAAHTRIQRSWRRFPGIGTALLHRHAPWARLWPSNPWTRAYLNLDVDPEATQTTDWVSGCCMVIRGALFRELGGLDPRFPLFCEDVDLCRRAHAAGQSVVYLPGAEIAHFTGHAHHDAPLRSAWLHHRSMIHYVLKHHRPWNPTRWLLVAGVLARLALQMPRLLARSLRIRRLAPRSISSPGDFSTTTARA